MLVWFAPNHERGPCAVIPEHWKVGREQNHEVSLDKVEHSVTGSILEGDISLFVFISALNLIIRAYSCFLNFDLF